MRHRALVSLAAVALAAAAAAPALAAAAPRVHVLVVGKSGVLRGPKLVPLKARTVKVGSRRCAVGTATPLSVLVATKLRLKLTDQGACSKRPADASGLYVASVAGQRERGRSGWVYKVGNRAGTTGAGDPSGPFGTGKRLHGGQHVLWFWCTLGSAGGCQRTLDARADRSSAKPGETLRVTVRGYDDNGKGARIAGATVRLGSSTAVSGADGVAVLTVPSAHGHLRLRATHGGMVTGFPREVAVG
jgi:hypothetical protein